jgi:hypothetical protein
MDDLNEKLNNLPSANRVTEAGVDSVIETHTFLYHGVLTICVITLRNGFNVIGESACVDPANYDQTIGNEIAYSNARDKIWLLEGYALAERLYHGYGGDVGMDTTTGDEEAK